MLTSSRPVGHWFGIEVVVTPGVVVVVGPDGASNGAQARTTPTSGPEASVRARFELVFPSLRRVGCQREGVGEIAASAGRDYREGTCPQLLAECRVARSQDDAFTAPVVANVTGCRVAKRERAGQGKCPAKLPARSPSLSWHDKDQCTVTDFLPCGMAVVNLYSSYMGLPNIPFLPGIAMLFGYWSVSLADPEESCSLSGDPA